MSNNTTRSRNLNQQRREAVQLRLDGLKLGDISKRTSLSAPTIISAHKAYLAGGWPAVNTQAPGRRAGKVGLSAELQTQLSCELHAQRPEHANPTAQLWSYEQAKDWLAHKGHALGIRTAQRYLQQWGFSPHTELPPRPPAEGTQAHAWYTNTYLPLQEAAKKQKRQLIWAGVQIIGEHCLCYAQTTRKKFYWLSVPMPLTSTTCIDFLTRLQQTIGKPSVVIFEGFQATQSEELTRWLASQTKQLTLVQPPVAAIGAQQNDNANSDNHTAQHPKKEEASCSKTTTLKTQHRKSHHVRQEDPPVSNQAIETNPSIATLNHLQRLEAESIHIMREVVVEAENPVMLYSMGKDSAVMLHLAKKAFYPAPPPFPLLHVDTTWKFRAMYEFRDRIARELGFELLTYTNPHGLEQGVNPFTHGSALHTDIMKTEALKQALDQYNFDVAFGGARRDEEKSRAKERVFSFRTEQHRWDPKNQRPELWRLYNSRKRQGESIRVFPLSNWTELDVWQYIYLQDIPIVPLYYAAQRPVVERDGKLLMVDDDRMPLHDGEIPVLRSVRFRTLGCYPLTAAVESTATTLPEIIQETLLTRTSERQGRMIDHDSAASMEKKKQEGYF